MRIALGCSYHGGAYQGWQSQRSGRTVQDVLEGALLRFAPGAGDITTGGFRTRCAGRTDAGVHALLQVVHFDTTVARAEFAWLRGTNAFLPPDIALQWARAVPDSFHARASATGRRYRYVLLQSPVRPSVDAGRVGWSPRPLDGTAMRAAAACLLGRHDFSAFRAASCQAKGPVRELRQLGIECRGDPAHSTCYWHFNFEADAFLHHMIRNIMGCLVAVGSGARPVDWLQQVLDARQRRLAAPTFAADGLYFLGPRYDPTWGLPEHGADLGGLPG